MRRTRLAVSLVIALTLAACASPEATRVRAGGPGADVGNRRDEVLMHHGAHPYWSTPRTAGVEGSALEPGRQAARLSHE